MKKTSYLILFVLIIFTFACQPKKNEPTKLELLTSKKWQLVGSNVYYPNQNITEDYYYTLSTCTTDNIFIFSHDGKYTVDEGKTKCNNASPQTLFSGTWNFVDDGNSITIRDEQSITKLKILQIDSNHLTLSNELDIVLETDSSKNIIKHIFTFTYKALE